MNPSSLRTWAMFCFSLVCGMSTAGVSLRFPLRMRVNISAIGSVIMAFSRSLPARLLHARDQTVARHVAEADSADAELAVAGTRPTAQSAAKPNADHVARTQ